MNTLTQYDQLAAAVPGLRPGWWLLLLRVAEHEDGVPLTRLYHGGHCTATSAQTFFRWAVSRGLLEVRARLHGTARGGEKRQGRPTVRIALTAKALKLLNQEQRTANPEPS